MRYDHHPDPAIAFEVEIDIIEGMVADVLAGQSTKQEVINRMQRAMQFRVGGDARAVAAKDRLRALLVAV